MQEIEEVPVFYLNREDKPERRASIESQLSSFNFKFTRLDAIKLKDSGGFWNKEIRGNWISHTWLIELSYFLSKNILVLEDDIIFTNFLKLKNYYKILQEKYPEFMLCYLYGSKSQEIERVQDLPCTHGYIVNYKYSKKLLESIDSQREEIERNKYKNWRTCLDRYLAHWLQKEYDMYGMPEVITQDRKKFGSDTGWGYKA